MDHAQGKVYLSFEHARLHAEAKASEAEAEKARYKQINSISVRRVTLSAYLLAFCIVVVFVYAYIDHHHHDDSVEKAWQDGYDAGVQEALVWKKRVEHADQKRKD